MRDDADELWPVLEIGGTHLTTALIDTRHWVVAPGSVSHRSFDATRSTDALISAMVEATAAVPDGHRRDWVVAIPGPFDYREGIGRFEHVGKFDSLRDVNVGTLLMARILPSPTSIRFLNDADAFGVGEFAIGAARGHRRTVCVTLGTGVGSAFLDEGEPVNSGPLVPPDGSVHLLEYDGRPLEETVSRRAIRAAYAAAAGLAPESVPDVHEIADRSRSGDADAKRVLHDAFASLGFALAPALHRFAATMLVVGGSMSRSWDIVEPALRQGLNGFPSLGELSVRKAERPDEAALVGAVFWARRQ